MRIALLLFSAAALALGQAQFPGAIAGDDDLLVAYDQAQSRLTAAMDADDTTFTVQSGSAFGNNMLVVIGSEQVFCTTWSTNTCSVATRGFAGTTAAAHAAGSLVSGYLVATHHNALAEEIKAIETALGINLANVPTGLVYRGVFSGLPAASASSGGFAIVTDCATVACSAGSGSIKVLLEDTGSSWSPAIGFDGVSGAVTDAQVPDSITITLAATATKLLGIAPNAQTGTTYTIQASDQGVMVTFSNASAIAVTVPQATSSFGSGFWFLAKNIGAADATLTPTTSTISGAASIVLSTGEWALIRSDGTNWEAVSNRATAGSNVTLNKSRTGVEIAASGGAVTPAAITDATLGVCSSMDANDYTCDTTDGNMPAAGDEYSIDPDIDATQPMSGPLTLSIDMVMADLVYPDGSDTGAGSLCDGKRARVMYDGTNWVKLAGEECGTYQQTLAEKEATEVATPSAGFGAAFFDDDELRLRVKDENGRFTGTVEDKDCDALSSGDFVSAISGGVLTCGTPGGGGAVTVLTTTRQSSTTSGNGSSQTLLTYTVTAGTLQAGDTVEVIIDFERTGTTAALDFNFTYGGTAYPGCCWDMTNAGEGFSSNNHLMVRATFYVVNSTTHQAGGWMTANNSDAPRSINAYANTVTTSDIASNSFTITVTQTANAADTGRVTFFQVRRLR